MRNSLSITADNLHTDLSTAFVDRIKTDSEPHRALHCNASWQAGRVLVSAILFWTFAINSDRNRDNLLHCFAALAQTVSPGYSYGTLFALENY
jgi:hypothetical protein